MKNQNTQNRSCRIIVAALSTAALLCACSQSQMPQMVGEYAVQVAAPTNRDISEKYSATIRGRQDIDVMPQVSGKLTELRVVEGQDVRQGQILFVIDQVPYRAALTTAEANVESAEANLATAKLTYESKQQLYEKKVISSYDLSTAENAYLSAKAVLAQANAQRVNAANNLSYTEVKSPSDGVVGTLPYRIGALVGPSGMQQPLTTVSDNSSMYIYFSLTEKQLLALIKQYGSKKGIIEMLPDIELQLSDKSIYKHKGRVETISGVVDRMTGTVSLRAVFPNPDGVLFSGTSGNVVITSSRQDVMVIPQTATFEVQDQVYVYKLQDGRASSAPVRVTRVNGGQEYIVEEGIAAGDSIIVEGAGMLKEGTQVRAKIEAI